MNSGDVLVRHMDAHSFTVTAIVHPHHVEFFGYRITGTSVGNPEERMWENRMGSHEPDFGKATAYFSGAVKWDGCSNWKFDEQESGVMLHACDRNIMTDVAETMSACWDWASELLSTWNHQ